MNEAAGIVHRGVSTHSRLKAAGVSIGRNAGQGMVSTHSRLKAAGILCGMTVKNRAVFQHTAA